MEKSLDNIPLNSQSWAKQASFLGRWLHVLFYLSILQFLAALPIYGLFPFLSIPHLCSKVMYAVYCFGSSFVFLKLSIVVKHYKTAGICFLIGYAAKALSSLSTPSTSSSVAFVASGVAIISSIVLLVAEWKEYRGHSKLLENADSELSRKWRRLWEWYMRLFSTLLASIVVINFTSFLGALMGLVAIVGLIMILIVKLVYLYRTNIIIRTNLFHRD